MTAVIITIGDEILIGQVIDTNSGYIAKSLDKIGIETVGMFSIGDNRDQILNTFKYFQDKVDFVMVTGGLGPTKDDITKKTFTDYFEDTLVVNSRVLDHIKEMWKKVFKMEVSLVNEQQALVPSKATVLFNPYG